MSFNQAIVPRITLLLSSVFAVLLLAACSFSPVYSGSSSDAQKFNLTFDQPTSRLEQIVYADLVAQFSRSLGQDTKNIKVVVSSSNVNPGVGSVGLSGVITIKNNSDGEVIFTGTRIASATFVSSGQALANQQAANEATERAAHQLAETIRLTIISVLSFPSPQ